MVDKLSDLISHLFIAAGTHFRGPLKNRHQSKTDMRQIAVKLTCGKKVLSKLFEALQILRDSDLKRFLSPVARLGRKIGDYRCSFLVFIKV